MRSGTERLPYAVGRMTAGWFLLIAAALALVALGAAAYALQLSRGEIVTGMRDIGTMGGSPWGLYIVSAVYFIGASFAGITVAALIRLLGLDLLKPVARMAEALTVTTILMGGMAILMDVGQPLRAAINLLRYARPQSPFFGTFTLVVSGYLFASLVYIYLDGRRDAAICARTPGPLQGFHRRWAAGYRDTPAERERHRQASLWLAIAIVPLLVTAHSTLGFVFGLQVGRPGWFSALQAPAFLIMAGISGLGLLIVVAAVMRRALGLRQQLHPGVFRLLGTFMMVLILAYLYFMVVEWLTTAYAGAAHEARIMQVLMFGQYAWLYWISVGCLVVPLALLLLSRTALQHRALPLMVVSGLMVNVAAVFKRYLIVIPSQTHGTLLPYGAGSYSPTWVEYSIVLGLVGVGTLVYAVFVKVFPILPMPEEGDAL